MSTLASILLLPVVLHAAWHLIRQQHRDRIEAFTTASLMDTVLSTTGGWLWAVGADGRFTFSSRASQELLGYEPSDLLGRPCSLVIDLADLKTARKPDAGAGREGLLLSARHRGGRRLSVEVVGRRRFDREGRGQDSRESHGRWISPGQRARRTRKSARELITCSPPGHLSRRFSRSVIWEPARLSVPKRSLGSSALPSGLRINGSTRQIQLDVASNSNSWPWKRRCSPQRIFLPISISP